ncbi:MAG TPA: hypothetical protein VEB42_13930, partial [Chitinophagaceae bacterium]|nr:hypothetical protein [Chitinophagaceae bacterium]
KKLEGNGPLSNGGSYNTQLNESGIAYKTTSDLLLNKRYDATRTAAMNIPSNINGAAFKDANGAYTYVLWAKTTQDLNENASATYNFPAGLVSGQLNKKQWDYSNTTTNTVIGSANIALTGTPIFLTDAGSGPPPPPPPATPDCNTVTITGGNGSIALTGITAPVATVQVFNSSWATVYNQVISNAPGNVTIPSLTAGTYNVKVTFYTAAWSYICEKFQAATVQNGTPPPPGGTPDCNAVTIAGTSSGLNLSGLTAPVVTVQIFNSGWATVFNQAYTNSPNNVSIPLGAGTYHVKIGFLNASWGAICERMIDANAGSGSTASQGSAASEITMERGLKTMTAAPNPFTSTIQVTIGSDKN